ncbi:ParA family protein [Gulosibacter bifidus]|uniref:ParA family protein n=1 Tax=Gulosibacter bifidus TaxID=272239 RepID=A0ABW5RFI1_9MICO|nr:ParA family protein [Gulosibacter bifidus]
MSTSEAEQSGLPELPGLEVPEQLLKPTSSGPSRQQEPAPNNPPAEGSKPGDIRSAEAVSTRNYQKFPIPAPLSGHGPARVIAMCNQKGGVGKTTTSINLAASLAGYGRRVLCIDFDPQGALSAGLGLTTHNVSTIYDLLIGRISDPHQAIQPTEFENLDVIPANIDLSAAEVHLVTEVAREQILASIIRRIADEYDLVIVDCQPSLGLLTVNALTASHGVMIPLECEYFALRGVALLIETIDKVRSRLNPSLELDGILPTMFDGRTLHSREVLDRVFEVFGDKVFDTVIGRTVKFPDASVAGVPIVEFAPNHPAAQAYRQLARELVARGAAA